jgi:hypothetical protein
LASRLSGLNHSSSTARNVSTIPHFL